MEVWPVNEIDAEVLFSMMDEEQPPSIIDVRSPDEFEAWNIQGALNLPLEELAGRLAEVPKGLVVTVCARGQRAQRAAEILGEDHREVLVLAGGMEAWGRAYDEVAFHVGAVTVVQVRRRGKGCLSYLVGGCDRCVVIDPSLDIERYVAIAHARHLEIAAVIDTHLHADHLSGAQLLAESTGATLVASQDDPREYETKPLVDGMTFDLGGNDALVLSAIATPGHTRGSVTLALGHEVLFTGDTLFIESVGRPDLADEAVAFATDLFQSLHESILRFPDEALVLPAHVSPRVPITADAVVGVTLGTLRQRVEALSMDEASFVTWASTQAAPRPPNYERIVALNMAGGRVADEERGVLELGPNRCAVDSTD